MLDLLCQCLPHMLMALHISGLLYIVGNEGVPQTESKCQLPETDHFIQSLDMLLRQNLDWDIQFEVDQTILSENGLPFVPHELRREVLR